MCEFHTIFTLIYSIILPYNLLSNNYLYLSHGAQPLGEKAQFEAKAMATWTMAAGIPLAPSSQTFMINLVTTLNPKSSIVPESRVTSWVQ